MPKVVPSQIVAFVDKSYGAEPQGGFGSLDYSNGPTIETISKLCKQIPEELIALGVEDFNTFTACVSAMEFWADRWRIGGNVGTLDKVRGHQQRHALSLLRAVLVKCPDAAPAATVGGLDFIDDVEYREQLRTDISAAYSAERIGEWKGATVIGGSVVEALLLWKLRQQNAAQVNVAVAAAAAAAAQAGFQGLQVAQLDSWNLAQYIEIARRMGLVSPNTAAQATLSRDFRNLIHPGKTVRTGQRCNRGTALSALAAIEHVVDDLS
jgi:hypothetical protein